MGRGVPPGPWLVPAHWTAARQCDRRLWLAAHAPELATPPDAEALGRRAIAAALRARAVARFPGAVSARGDVARTRALLADASVPAVIDAAVRHDGVEVRADLLERRATGGLALWHVRSGTSVRPEHVHALAVVCAVLAACGVRIEAVGALVVDRAYVRDAAVDWGQLFAPVDVTAAVLALRGGVAARGARVRRVLAAPSAPAIEPSPHCRVPDRCAFWAYCTRAHPPDWIMRLPRLAPNHHAALHAAGIDRMRDIPPGWWLTGPQARASQALATGRVAVAPGLAAALAPAAPPAGYLDFETIAPAVPLLPGTRPYETIPFQWSLHHDDGRGGLVHHAFLAEGQRDPRRAVAESLLAAAGTSREPIVVWSGYEAMVLDLLARVLPEHAAALVALRERLVDLLQVVLDHVYHPVFDGSFSLKQVAPALAPGFAWDAGGAITYGMAASAAYQRLATAPPAAEAAALRAALLDYCATDTRALVEVHRALRALTDPPPGETSGRRA